MMIGQAGVFLLMIFFADASITAWRRGRRAAAVVVGGILTLLMLSGGGLAVIVYWAGGEAPNTLTLFCLGIVAVMAYALSTDLPRAKHLAVELSEKESGGGADRRGGEPRHVPTRDITRARDRSQQRMARAVRLSPGRAADT